MKAKFHHAGLVVPDLDRAHKFYKEFLELTESIRFEWDQDGYAR